MRRVGACVALLLCAAALAACAPEPAPTPTSTAAFATEEGVFAAAEETYRAYTDALNDVDLSDPPTFEAIFEKATGDFEASDRKVFSEMYADELTLTGDAKVISFTPKNYSDEEGSLTALVCLDVSATDVTDTLGNSQVADDRPDRYPLEIHFEVGPEAVLIASSEQVVDPSCGS